MNSKNDEDRSRKRDPVQEIFEEMQRKIDEMMNARRGNPFKGKKTPRENPKNIKINFTLEETNKKPHEPNQKPGQAPLQEKRQRRKEEMLDIIDKANEVNVILELGESPEEEEIETELKNNKLSVKTPGKYKEIALTGKPKRIKEKNYKNNILEIKIDKEERKKTK